MVLKCGYAHEGNEPPLKCPLWGHAKEYYEPVEKEYC
ncbi:MAG: rubredoxin-like domain-containing protein [Bacillota bacterium]